MRSSGVNAKVKFRERFVSPRLEGAIKDALELIQSVGPDLWDGGVLDFADAFKQLIVAKGERRYLGGRALNGVVCYNRVTFWHSQWPVGLGPNGSMIDEKHRGLTP